MIKRDPSQERTLGKSEALLFAFSSSSLEHNGSRFKGENGGLRICENIQYSNSHKHTHRDTVES